MVPSWVRYPISWIGTFSRALPTKVVAAVLSPVATPELASGGKDSSNLRHLYFLPCSRFLVRPRVLLRCGERSRCYIIHVRKEDLACRVQRYFSRTAWTLDDN